MKHLIVTEDVNSLPKVRYDRIILDTTTNEIVYMNGELTYEVIPDEYIYNDTDNKYYQKLVAYSEPIKINSTVDLNSEWIFDQEDSNYTYFKSDSNFGVGFSYSQCKVTWSNLTSITFKYMSSEGSGDECLCVGYLDGEKFTSRPSYNSDNVYLSTRGKAPGEYDEFTIECDEDEHHIWFCYRKYEDTEDRGFIGVPKRILSIVDIKQGEELPPTEYKFGGVSVEDGKTYDINYKGVILPNGNIVDDYKDVEKTEKTITYEYVDLGLPSGLKWATCNVGATTETDYGVYFQWGETNGVSESLVGKYSDKNYSWATYEHCEGTMDTLTKYTTTDGKTTLDPEDDAATQIMGDGWRMPTETEFQELLTNTNHEWIYNHNGTGIEGRKFTSKTDTSKYIFIPAAGRYRDGSAYYVGDGCYVWGSSLNTLDEEDAWSLHSDLDGYEMSNRSRYEGYSVRGVRK